MALSNLKSAYSWYDKNSGYKPNTDQLSTDFVYNDDLTSTTIPRGFDDFGNRVSFIPKTSKNEFVITDQGTSSRLAQLGSGTKFPIGPKGQIHNFDIKRTGFSINNKYENVYNNLSNFGLADTYTKDSPIDDMYNIVKVRDVASRRGYAREPFILRGIQRDDNSDPQRFGPTITLDLPRAGVITATNRMALDVARISKFMITPKGLLFNVKQFGQQLMNPNVEGFDGLPGKIINPNSTKLYTPINLMANVAGGYLGLRTRRHGLLPMGSAMAVEGRYEDVFKNRNSIDMGTKFNRLVQVGGELGLFDAYAYPAGTSQRGPLGKVGAAISSGADKLKKLLGFEGQVINTLTGLTGPGSVGGLGRTAITRTVNTLNTPKIDPNTGYLTNSTLEDTRDKRNLKFQEEATEEKSLLKDKVNDKNFDGTADSTSLNYKDDNRVSLFDSLKGPKKEDSRWSLIPSTDDERKNIKKKFNPTEDTDKTLSEKVLDDKFDGIKSDKSNEAEYESDYQANNASVYTPENIPNVNDYKALVYGEIKKITKNRVPLSTKILDFGRQPDTSKADDAQYEFDYKKTRLYQKYVDHGEKGKELADKMIDKKINDYDTSNDPTDTLVPFLFVQRDLGITARFKAYIVSWNDDIAQITQMEDNQGTGTMQKTGAISPTERSANINFLIAANNPEELSEIYAELAKIRRLAADTRVGKASSTTRITLGDIYKGTKCYIEGVSVNWDSEYTWELTPGSQVPYILDVSLDLVFDQANVREQYDLAYVG